jgi:hypothetical protein
MLLRVVSGKLSEQLAPARPGESTEIEECFEQLLTLLGYYFLENEENQATLPNHPMLLNRLATLPYRFFSDENGKNVLFPTLLALCYPCPTNKELLANEMNTQTLSLYLDRCIAQRDATLADWSATGTEGATLPAWAPLALRFPVRHWHEAATFFRS